MERGRGGICLGEVLKQPQQHLINTKNIWNQQKRYDLCQSSSSSFFYFGPVVFILLLLLVCLEEEIMQGGLVLASWGALKLWVEISIIIIEPCLIRCKGVVNIDIDVVVILSNKPIWKCHGCCCIECAKWIIITNHTSSCSSSAHRIIKAATQLHSKVIVIDDVDIVCVEIIS